MCPWLRKLVYCCDIRSSRLNSIAQWGLLAMLESRRLAHWVHQEFLVVTIWKAVTCPLLRHNYYCLEHDPQGVQNHNWFQLEQSFRKQEWLLATTYGMVVCSLSGVDCRTVTATPRLRLRVVSLWIATWLILPVVIRSSQRLSHACLSINTLLWNCERLIISVIIYLIVPYYLDNRSNSRANTCVNTLLG